VENGTPFMMRYTQSNASAQRFGVLQPIESANIIDARGQTVTLSARVRMSASTTLRYAVVEWTGTTDNITKDVVNDWTSGTFATGNFFISTTTAICGTGSTALTANTPATISLSCTVSGSMNNLHVFFWTDSTQAQTVTLDVGKVQLEIGSSATPLAFRSIQEELNLCQRYFQVSDPDNPSGSAGGAAIIYALASDRGVGAYSFGIQMRISPAISAWNNGTQNRMFDEVAGGVVAIGQFSSYAISKKAISYGYVASGLTGGHHFAFDIQANARL
jgi:hypothetical protein